MGKPKRRQFDFAQHRKKKAKEVRNGGMAGGPETEIPNRVDLSQAVSVTPLAPAVAMVQPAEADVVSDQSVEGSGEVVLPEPGRGNPVELVNGRLGPSPDEGLVVNEDGLYWRRHPDYRDWSAAAIELADAVAKANAYYDREFGRR